MPIIQLTAADVAKFKKPVRGRGGFQSLLRAIAKKIQPDDTVSLTDGENERLIRYSFQYGQGGFEDRIKPTARRRAART